VNWGHEIAWFFGGAFLTNALPHWLAGLMGRPFQSPFAKPPGQGLSSSAVNVLWGFANFAAAYFLLLHVGHFDLYAGSDIAAPALGGLLMALHAARHFGQFHGGNEPLGKSPS